MTLPGVQVTCNWNQIGGCELTQNVSCKLKENAVFKPPPLDTILEAENALLLKQHDSKGPCEFRIKLPPSSFEVTAITIVSTVQKLELFLGPQNDYTNVHIAEQLEDFDEDGVFTFRHDIEIAKSDIAELMLKMLPSSDEICIFGTVLQIIPNRHYIDFSKFWWSKSNKQNELPVPARLTKNEAKVLFENKMKTLRKEGGGNNSSTPAESTFSIDLENENHCNVTVQVACNWQRTGGCEFSQNVRGEVTHEYCYIPPQLETIVENDNAIFLKPNDNIKEPCEIHFKLLPTIYKIEAISLVSNVAKMEVFLGPLNEYTDTIYSNSLEDKRNDIAFTYRHDIQVQRSGITDITLKLITPSPEICIFGTVLQIAPNPNGITTGTNIDLAKLLNNCENFPRKEACMLFLKSIANKQADLANKNERSATEAMVATTPALDGALKTYLDNKFEQLERNINERLDIAIGEQNAKLAKILDMLVNKTIV